MPEIAPLVSVVMPCFNAQSRLRFSVGSVLAQTFQDFELIAVDDGSSDGTMATLRSFCMDRRLLIHSQENAGVSAARNLGIGLARGRYVAFLDADDTWDINFLSTMVKALEDNGDVVLAYCGWRNIGLTEQRGKPFIPPDYETSTKLELLFENCRWPIHAALTRRDILLISGGFDLKLKNSEDYALWMEIASLGRLLRVAHVLAYYHFHDGAQASKHLVRAAFHHMEAQLEYTRRHPDFRKLLGRSKRRRLIYGNLLRQGYECYWKRDLLSARIIFCGVMRAGYGNPSDWKYMLPSLLPISWHKVILRLRKGE